MKISDTFHQTNKLSALPVIRHFVPRTRLTLPGLKQTLFREHLALRNPIFARYQTILKQEVESKATYVILIEKLSDSFREGGCY